MAFDLDDEELEATRKLNGVGMSKKEMIEIVKSIAENAEAYDAITDDGIRAIKRIL